MSRYGYNSLENMEAALNRTIESEIPIDVQYAVICNDFFDKLIFKIIFYYFLIKDIDHFRDQLDFTYNQVNFSGLPEYIEDIQSKGMKFIIILVILS